MLAYLQRSKACKVVPRGAGTSLSGGAIPQEDAVVVGVAKMNRVLDVDFANRIARVEAGVTNLAISERGGARGLLLRARSVARSSPAPSPATSRMNSGGAHCLKYGVTTNNVLGVRLVLIDGDDRRYRRRRARRARLRPARPRLSAPRASSASSPRRPCASCARPKARGRCCSASPSARTRAPCVAAIIGAGIIPVAMEFMDRPAIQICEAFAHAGYPLDVEAMLIIEVEGSEAEMDDDARPHRRHRPQHMASRRCADRKSAMESARDLEGPQIGLRRHGPHRRLYLHGRHHPDRPAALGADAHRRDLRRATACASPTSSTPATATCIR